MLAENGKELGFVLAMVLFFWLACKLAEKPPTPKLTAKQRMFRGVEHG